MSLLPARASLRPWPARRWWPSSPSAEANGSQRCLVSVEGRNQGRRAPVDATLQLVGELQRVPELDPPCTIVDVRLPATDLVREVTMECAHVHPPALIEADGIDVVIRRDQPGTESVPIRELADSGKQSATDASVLLQAVQRYDLALALGDPVGHGAHRLKLVVLSNKAGQPGRVVRAGSADDRKAPLGRDEVPKPGP